MFNSFNFQLMEMRKRRTIRIVWITLGKGWMVKIKVDRQLQEKEECVVLMGDGLILKEEQIAKVTGLLAKNPGWIVMMEEKEWIA